MKLLNIKIISPDSVIDLKAKFISLNDKLGSFGVYPGHRTYITFLDRSVGHYIDENDNKKFMAYDFGLFRIEEKDNIFIISRVVLIGDSVEHLEDKLSKRIEKEDIYSSGIRENIEHLQKALIKEFMKSNILNQEKKL